MKNRPTHERLGFALAGLRECWRTESSFRIHLLLGFCGAVILAFIKPEPIWWALSALIVLLALAFELMNSALERLIDHLHPNIHPEIGSIKDMASGAVFLMGVASVITLIALLVRYF